MGSKTDIMHRYALQEIRRQYSEFDHWVVSPVKSLGGYNQVYRAERAIEGHNQEIMVLVSFEKKIPAEMLDSLQKDGRNAYGITRSCRRHIIVPQNADTSSVPADIIVGTMQSFRLEGNDLVWTKKPRMKTPEAPAVSGT